jgi:hypothetical protein
VRPCPDDKIESLPQAKDFVAPIIERCPTDDLEFIELVKRAISEELNAKAVHGLFLIRIANWFDEKWRNFSGKGRVAYGHFTGLAYNPDTSLEAIHRDRTKSTFPPFTPNRVRSQDFYHRDEKGVYVLEGDGPWVHPRWRQRSSANLHQRITTHNNSCLFVWFSSNKLTNRRGSLMVYRVNGTIVTSWYTSFSLNGEWRVVRTLGIARQLLVRWFGPAQAPVGDSSLCDPIESGETK